MGALAMRVLLPTLGAALLLTSGCALVRPPAPAQPQVSPARQSLAQAEALLADDDVGAAVRELHRVLESYPESPEAPQALFVLAIAYLSPASALHDASQGLLLLQNLRDEYPETAWSMASETVLRLAETNRDLRQLADSLRGQLDKLKAIDIGTDG